MPATMKLTTLRIGNIRLRERYAEGEIPHKTKTGGGPILLTCSYPYVRDWLNKHPFKNTPQARLIYSLRNGRTDKTRSIMDYDETIAKEDRKEC